MGYVNFSVIFSLDKLILLINNRKIDILCTVRYVILYSTENWMNASIFNPIKNTTGLQIQIDNLMQRKHKGKRGHSIINLFIRKVLKYLILYIALQINIKSI